MSKKNKSTLGRSLIKDHYGQANHKKKVNNDSMLHTTEVQDGYDWGRLNLQSVTEESSFQEFLRTAELAGTEFQAEKLNIAFVNPKSNIGLLSKTEETLLKKKHFDKKDLLKIPRRPKWTQFTTAEDLQKAEGESFLEWRRNIALLQEDDEMLMTPYEKNLEFWRQLWRVVEKSDVVVQIVDARNPLLFRSKDLEDYVKEVDDAKMNMILVNKSDLLTPEQRQIWAEYFDKENIKVAFFSAVQAEEEAKAAKLKEQEEEDEEEKNAQNSDEAEVDEDDDDSKAIAVEELRKATEAIIKGLDKTEEQLRTIENQIGVVQKTQGNSSQLLNRAELTELFRNVYQGTKKLENIVTIGLVGYPNVGKSSTINALMAEKKVSVSATPGKTKHFQTLFLEKDIMLCDCPGLVMPSFVLTKADMILNGILPIDQMRDHVPPVNLLCARIPKHILEDKYGIIIAKPIEGEDPNRPPHAEELLLAYGYNRGFMTANGQPDQSRSARYVLKDYVNGKLLYCHAPNGVEQESFHTFPARVRKEIEEESLPKQQQRAMRINKNTAANEINDQFFKTNSGAPHAKGRASFPHIGNSSQGDVDGQATGVPNKPWRRPKKEKREKLRKKFVHLDQH
ncbi:large subunit GTPase 1 homolog [Episyrphus balteatus]|uniref:large subunit GTPase 1 homolog n=1 Tax=Episyrphus balteatus TaxID=286459 RepID=UPI002486B264|nr:large subunit GTPase 1 homolog [Episyrphus balteatus]